MATTCYDRVWYCTKCGKQIPYIIPRQVSKLHRVGHLKKLWCLNCKQEWNAAETEEWTKYSRADFFFEFENGNFSENGERILPYGQFRMKMYKEGATLPS